MGFSAMSHDTRLGAIREKVEAGVRLSFEDGVYLDEQADLFTLGELANLVRERKNGNFAYYNVNTHSTRPMCASIAAPSVPSGPI
jgi:2-iminoacetate synthase ThiH